MCGLFSFFFFWFCLFFFSRIKLNRDRSLKKTIKQTIKQGVVCFVFPFWFCWFFFTHQKKTGHWETGEWLAELIAFEVINVIQTSDYAELLCNAFFLENSLRNVEPHKLIFSAIVGFHIVICRNVARLIPLLGFVVICRSVAQLSKAELLCFWFVVLLHA